MHNTTFLTFLLLPAITIAQAPQVKPLKGAEGIFLCTALSADGKKLATGARDGSVGLWDTDTRNEGHHLTGHKGNVLAVAFAPKGEFLVSAGSDKSVRVWSLDGREKVKPIACKDVPTCVAVSPDGKRIAYAGWDSAIHQVNADNGETIGERPAEQGPIFSLIFSPDGKWLASGGRRGTVQIWEATNELKPVATLPDNGRTVWALSWTPDSATLAASADKSVKIWNVAEKKLTLELTGHKAPIRALAFTDGGKKLISGSEDKTVKVWDLARKSAETLAGANGSVVGAAVSPDGKSIYTVADEAGQSARVFVLGKE